MIKAGQKKRGYFAPFLAAFGAAFLLIAQIGTSLGHEDHSHSDALEQVCDYCIIEQSLGEGGTDTEVEKVQNISIVQMALPQLDAVHHPRVYLIQLSRAPPLAQNTYLQI